MRNLFLVVALALISGCVASPLLVNGAIDAGIIAWDRLQGALDPDEQDALSGLRVGIRADGERTVLTVAGVEAFPSGSSSYAGDYQAELAGIARVLGLPENRNLPVEVTGYTDSTGRHDQNVRLSQQRAGAVARALVDQGVERGRITVFGAGPVHPVADNSTAAGRSLNRRVEVKF